MLHVENHMSTWIHCMIVCQSNTSLMANGGSNRGVSTSGANGYWSRNDLAHHGKL